MSDGNRPKIPVTFDALIRHLPLDIDESEVKEPCSQFGKIASTYLKEDMKNENEKFGYVRYFSEEDRDKALFAGSVTIRGVKIKLYPTSKREKRDTLSGPRGYTSDRNNLSGPSGGARSWTNSSHQNKPDIVSNHQPSAHKFTPGTLPSGRDTSGQIKQRTSEQVLVTAVDTPCVFWAQSKQETEQKQIIELQESLATSCPMANPVSGQPLQNKLYATKFSLDGNWYRCQVLKYKGDNKCEVRYVDYGNCEVVEFSAIRELLPKSANSKTFAQRYILYGLVPLYKDDSIGYEDGVKRLRKMIEYREVTVNYLGKENTYVEVETEDNVSVNQTMLSEGFAEIRKPKSLRDGDSAERGRPGPGPHDRGDWHSGPGNKSVGGGFKIKKERESQDNSWDHPPVSQDSGVFDVSQTRNQQQQQQQQSQQQNPPSSDINFGTWNTPTPARGLLPEPSVPSPMFPGTGGVPTATHDNSYLQTELQETLKEVGRLRSELAVSHQERTQAEQEMNHMVLEHAKLKGELRNLTQDCASMTQQLQETSLYNRLKTLLINVHRIKQLRKQFPTERETRDNIEWAIELLRENFGKWSVNDLEVATKVKVATEAYEKVQENIRTCKDMSSLDELIVARDEARKELHKFLVEFEEKVCHLPLEEKKAQLQEALDALNITHSFFMQTGNITQPQHFSETLEWYMTWKSKKTAEFREKRALTNACHNSLKSALNILHQELSLDMDQSSENPLIAANLDEPMKKYNSAVISEIATTDMEKTEDAKLVMFILKFVVDGIHSELRQIDHLAGLISSYSAMASKISVWLEDKPDVSALTKVKRTIKGLKSKLRHLLADRQDLLESDDSEGGELDCLEENLSEIRNELQGAFKEEDRILAELALLSLNHFPELSLQHPDVGISNEIENEGLVKMNRSVEYFETRPLPGCVKSSVMRAKFCGEPIILKEFIVDDSIGINKNEFLRRALAYHHIKHPNLLPLQAVFCDNTKRNSYIQLPFVSNSADGMFGSSVATKRGTFNVLYGVLKGLQSLHEAKLVHGSVHPRNVLINSNGEGILAEFDFTKSVLQRAQQEYVSKSGLRFSPPEVASQNSVSRASDIYNFGLLALWLSASTDAIRYNISGIPELQNVRFEDQALATIVQIVLNENPAARPTATDLLLFPYFVNEPKGEELRLQLRPKQPSPPLAEKTHGGILKNSPNTPPPPLESFTQIDVSSGGEQTPTTPDQEVVSILGGQPPDLVTPALSLFQDGGSHGGASLDHVSGSNGHHGPAIDLSTFTSLCVDSTSPDSHTAELMPSEPQPSAETQPPALENFSDMPTLLGDTLPLENTPETQCDAQENPENFGMTSLLEKVPGLSLSDDKTFSSPEASQLVSEEPESVENLAKTPDTSIVSPAGVSVTPEDPIVTEPPHTQSNPSYDQSQACVAAEQESPGKQGTVADRIAQIGSAHSHGETSMLNLCPPEIVIRGPSPAVEGEPKDLNDET